MPIKIKKQKGGIRMKKQKGSIQMKKQKGGIKMNCVDVRERHTTSRNGIRRLLVQLDQAKVNNLNPNILEDDVIVTPWGWIFNKQYNDEIADATQGTKGLATDINSFAMYSSHNLFKQYYTSLLGCPKISRDNPIRKMIDIYTIKRKIYRRILRTYNDMQQNTPEYNFVQEPFALSNLNDYREVVFRPYRIINNLIARRNRLKGYDDNQKIYFVFKGGLSLKYMLESLIADMQCNVPKKNGGPQVRPDDIQDNDGHLCNESRQKSFNKVSSAHSDGMQFQELIKEYIGQDAKSAYFKASDFDTGIYIFPGNFNNDYMSVSKYVLNVLMDQKKIFDIIWKHNTDEFDNFTDDNICRTDIINYWNSLEALPISNPLGSKNYFTYPIEEGEQFRATVAKNNYYKMCVDLFLDRVRIITYLVDLLPFLYTADKKKRKGVKDKHLKFIKLFGLDNFDEIIEKQVFNDVNIPWRTGKIDKDENKFISPVNTFGDTDKYPEHSLQNILFDKYKVIGDGNNTIRGRPKTLGVTPKITFTSTEFQEQCFGRPDDWKVLSFKDDKKTPYYISNNDSIILNRLTERERRELVRQYPNVDIDDPDVWPTGRSEFALIRSKFNYKVMTRYTLNKSAQVVDYNIYRKDAPGEMIDISIPRPNDIDIRVFYAQPLPRNNQGEAREARINNQPVQIVQEGGMKHQWLTSINGINTLNMNYIIKDTLQMLGFHSICPWSDKKYEKRLYRLLIALLFKYLLEISATQDNILPSMEGWIEYSKEKLLPIYEKLERGSRSCADYLFKGEDEVINSFEQEIVYKWNKIIKRKKKIGEKKSDDSDWIERDLTRTFSLKLYIRNLFDNWDASDQYLGDEAIPSVLRERTNEKEFDSLVYITAYTWIHHVFQEVEKEKKKQQRMIANAATEAERQTARDELNKFGRINLDSIANYLFFVLPRKDTLTKERIKKALNHDSIVVSNQANNILFGDRPRGNEQENKQITNDYSIIRKYISRFRTYYKYCKTNKDIKKDYIIEAKTNQERFKKSLGDIGLELYNKYVKNEDLGNKLMQMDIRSARYILQKYYGEEANDLYKIRTYRGGNKIRKHRGIHQIGGRVGKLKKGYKYTGKRLKNGKAEIKKVKLTK